MVTQLILINTRTDQHTQSIAEFKINTINKIRKDSLDVRHKLDLVVDEPSKFMDQSADVQRGFQRLLMLLGMWALFEVVVFFTKKGSGTKSNSNDIQT